MQTLNWVVRPVAFMHRCRERYGRSFTVSLGPLDEVVFSADPRIVEQVFTGDPELLRMGDINGLLRPIAGSRSLLLLDGDDHLRERRLLLPFFHGAAVARLRELVGDITRAEVARWPMDTPMPVLPSMQRITLEVIVRAVMGIEGGPRYRRLTELIPEMISLGQSSATMLPWLRHELGGRSPWGRMMRVVREIDDELYEEIAQRRARAVPGEDVMSCLIAARYDDGAGMDDVAIRDQLLTLLAAGHETIANTLAFAFERLVHHPHTLDELVEDLQGGGEGYLEAVSNETLRQRPVLPIVARKLAAPMQLGPWALPAGAVIMPCVWLLHHDPEIYPEPFAFRPSRFLSAKPGKYTWIPFGGGVRRCLGAALAQMELKVVLATVLQEVALRAAEPEPEPVRRRSLTFAPGRGARVIAAPRSAKHA